MKFYPQRECNVNRFIEIEKKNSFLRYQLWYHYVLLGTRQSLSEAPSWHSAHWSRRQSVGIYLQACVLFVVLFLFLLRQSQYGAWAGLEVEILLSPASPVLRWQTCVFDYFLKLSKSCSLVHKISCFLSLS